VIKILLVNPSCLDERISSEDAQVVPMGLYYIGALLIKNRFDVQILNLAQQDPDPLSVFEQTVKNWNPDIIGFSVSNPNRWNAIQAAGLAKKENPNVKIVFGGPCATFLDDHLFDACPELDFIVRGEGEYSFLELIKAIAENEEPRLDKIKGLVFRQNGALFKTCQREPVHDLDSLPHPSDSFTFQHISMSRGCPGKCTFCGSPKFWGKSHVRFHSPEWVAHEIETLFLKGVRHFFISDDTFTMDKPRVIALCKIMISKNLGITWNAISRVDFIDRDILFWMRKAGCIQISYGIESGSKSIRKVLGKPVDQEKIVTAFELTVSYGIMPRAYFIYGSPGESEFTIKDSINLMKKTRPLSCIFYILVLFPGTLLYERALKKGMISDNLWSQKIEDLPWFDLDESLDFKTVKQFGDQLRKFFYNHVDKFAKEIDLVDEEDLYHHHADFLSRLGMTFSHGEYAVNNQVFNQDETAKTLYNQALSFYPDFRAYLGISMLLQKQRKFAEAISFLERGLTHFPDNKDLNTCMGVCLMNTGRFQNALDFFQKAGPSEDIKSYIRICRQKTAGQ